MKLNIKQSIFLAAILLTVVIAGCQKSDSKTPFGYTYIYMPQAISSGGTTVNYAVPSGLDSATHNYKIDAPNNKVYVMLGVSRAGKEVLDAYTVNIAPRTDTVATILAGGTLGSTAIAMPSDVFTLPASISVPQGQYAATFYMTLDLTKLKTYTGKKLVMGVQLSSPSKFMLSAPLSKTIVVVDVTALKLP